jgi:hypothetical protein
MTLSLGLYIAIFAAALGALIARSRLASHMLLGLAGLFGLIYAYGSHGFLGMTLPFLMLIVAAVQASTIVGANRSAKFSDDEKGMIAGPLAGLGRAQARRLIDQGVWLEGKSGEVLIQAGEPAAQLYYIASGAGDVHAHGKLVGRVVPGQLVGEATVLGEAAAIATVTLTEPSRFWCAQGRALNAYLAANPDARYALEHGFTVSLRQKLEAMNRAAG